MNGLALCAGIGGLELGLKLVLGDTYRTVCYVEREAHAAVVLAARMEEGCLDQAPIWSDLTTFDGLPWRGSVDIVTAGFPCQPFSLAGKRLKEKDPRHIWPHIARIIGECEPSLVFLENVHVSAFRQPFADLRAMGFTLPPPYACTAAEMGAGHLRRRVFVLAYRSAAQWWKEDECGGCKSEREDTERQAPGGSYVGIADVSTDAEIGLSRPTRWREGSQDAQGSVPSDAINGGLRIQSRRCSGKSRKGAAQSEEVSRNATEQPGRPGVEASQRHPTSPEITGAAWWASEPRLERLVHGVPHRVDRNRALGNAVVPVVAAKAFVELMRQKAGGDR